MHTPVVTNKNLLDLSIEDIKTHITQTITEFNDFVAEYEFLYTSMKGINEKIILSNSQYANFISDVKSYECYKEQLELEYNNFKNKIYDYSEIFKFSSENQIDILKDRIDDLEKQKVIQSNIDNILLSGKSGAKLTFLLKRIKDLSGILEKNDNSELDRQHLYQSQYLEVFKENLPELLTTNTKFSNQTTLFNNEIKRFENALTLEEAKQEEFLKRKHYLSSWDNCIDEIEKHINCIYSDKNEESSNLLPASYLIHLVLTGKISFRLDTRLFSNQANFSDINTFTDECSFTQAYAKFIAGTKENKEIYFDTLSPQYLPFGEEYEEIDLDFMKNISTSKNTESDSFKSLKSDFQFVPFAKPVNSPKSTENWKFSIPKKYSFKISKLPHLVQKTFYNEEIHHPSSKYCLSSPLDNKTFSQANNETNEIENAPSEKTLSEWSNFIHDKLQNFSVYKILYSVINDLDLRKNIVHGGEIQFVNVLDSCPNDNILSQKSIYSRSVNAANNQIIPPTEVYLIGQQLNEGKAVVKCIFPFANNALPYDNNFSPFFKSISDIYSQYQTNTNSTKVSISWNNLFYLFLFSQGITFSKSKKNDYMIYIPVSNSEILKESDFVYTTLQKLSIYSNIKTSYEFISFFQYMFFSTDDISKHLSKDLIQAYYKAPYKNFIEDSKLNVFKEYMPQSIQLTFPEKISLILKKLLEEPSYYQMLFSTAVLGDIAFSPLTKTERYMRIFLDPNLEKFIEVKEKLESLHKCQDSDIEKLKKELEDLNKLIETHLNSPKIKEIYKLVCSYLMKDEEVEVAKKKKGKKKKSNSEETSNQSKLSKISWRRNEPVKRAIKDFENRIYDN